LAGITAEVSTTDTIQSEDTTKPYEATTVDTDIDDNTVTTSEPLTTGFWDTTTDVGTTETEGVTAETTTEIPVVIVESNAPSNNDSNSDNEVDDAEVGVKEGDDKPEFPEANIGPPSGDTGKPSTGDGCTDSWVAVHVGPDGSPNAVGGLGGCEAKPGQYFNCSDTVITENVYNCTVVDAPKPEPPPGEKPAVICKDVTKIEECLNDAGGETGEPVTTSAPPQSPTGEAITTPKTPNISPPDDGTKGGVMSLDDIRNVKDFRTICGKRPWLDKTFRSQAATPRGGRMIGGQRTSKEVEGLWTHHARRGKIVNGEDAKYGEWPWQVSLRQWRTATFLHKCGAALLSENWAITAAHCVESVNPDELLLRMGEFDLNDEEHEPFTFQDRKVQIVASHPKFDPKTFEYDLALLRFYEPVVFTPNIIPVCIPEDDEDLVGKEAWVTGWGRLYEDGPLPSKMQKVTLPIINNTECELMYEKAGFREHIPHIFICAGYREGGKDSCEGDSGGPMSVARRDGRYMLSGVISWGIGCAEKNQPGVYTRISDFREWINQILQY